MTDPIADLFTRIRNAAEVGHRTLDVPHSKLKEAVGDLLVREGFVKEQRVTEVGGRRRIRLYLRYDQDGVPVIQYLHRVSRPGLRVYRDVRSLPHVRRGLGVGIYTTSRGVLTDRECRERRLGGEYMGRVW
ncbi:MAG: 30S ribosomal protein S8 [Planctomycetota bacterium]